MVGFEVLGKVWLVGLKDGFFCWICPSRSEKNSIVALISVM